MKRLMLTLVLALSSMGCNKVAHIMGDAPSHKKQVAHYVVACCRDNNNGVLTYPSFVPVAHAQLCESIRQAALNNDGMIDGDNYLAMNVDCDPKFGAVGSQYYAGKGY